jgi:hypothetical protein
MDAAAMDAAAIALYMYSFDGVKSAGGRTMLKASCRLVACTCFMFCGHSSVEHTC